MKPVVAKRKVAPSPPRGLHRQRAGERGAFGCRSTRAVGYDVNGYLASVTDPLDRTVTTERDRDGRPTQLHLPDGRTIGLVPDPKGNLTELATPAGPVHQFGYDPLDRETRYQAPLADAEPTITDTEYDLDGNPTRQTLPGGLIIDFSYDAAGRLKTVSRPSQAGDHGNEVQLAYTYDGPLTTAETSTGAVAGQVRYGYDHDLRLNQLTIPGGTIAYAYDPDGLLTRASLQAGSANAALTLTRDPANGLLQGSQAGAVSDQWTWNGFGEPTRYEAKHGAASLYAADFTRDRLGRITGKTEVVQGQTTTYAYRYDLAGRLDQVTVNGQVIESYTYDPNGNRESLTRGGQRIDYTHDAQDRLLAQGDCTYTWTPAGSLDSQTCAGSTTAYTYTAQGDLTAADLPDGTALEYLIDGRGRRAGKRVNGQLVQAFIYQDQLNPVAELDGNGQVKATFVYADRGHVPSLMHKAGRTYRLVADHLGSVRLVVDIDSGAIAQRIDYDAWGNVLTDTNPGFQPFGYAGGLYDRDLDLVRFGARDYDPEIGRWTAKDPIRFEGGDGNLYAYTHGNPIDLIDPSGLYFRLSQEYVQGQVNVMVNYGKTWLGLSAGVGVAATAVVAAPAAVPLASAAMNAGRAAMCASPIASNPQAQQQVVDFASGFLDPGPPPMSPAGRSGFWVRQGVEKAIGVFE